MVGGVGGEVVEVKFGRSGSSGCGTLHACVRREEFSVVVVFLGGERGSSVFISGGWLQKGSDVVKGSLRRMSDGSTGLVGELVHSRHRGDGKPWSEASIEMRLGMATSGKAFCRE